MAVLPPVGAVVVTITAMHGLHASDAVLLAIAAFVVRRALRRTAEPGASQPGDRPFRMPRFERPLPLAYAAIGAGLVILGLVGSTDAKAWSTGTFTVALLPIVAVSVGAIGGTVTSGGSSAVWLAGAAFVGYVVDSVLQPTGTAFGPAFLAGALARSGDRRECGHYHVIAMALVSLNVLSLADVADVDVVLADSGGAVYRTIALGTVLVVGVYGDRLRGPGVRSRQNARRLRTTRA